MYVCICNQRGNEKEMWVYITDSTRKVARRLAISDGEQHVIYRYSYSVY